MIYHLTYRKTFQSIYPWPSNNRARKKWPSNNRARKNGHRKTEPEKNGHRITEPEKITDRTHIFVCTKLFHSRIKYDRQSERQTVAPISPVHEHTPRYTYILLIYFNE